MNSSPVLTVKTIARFWAFVTKGSGCWLWGGSYFRLKDRKSEQWYGRFSLKNRWMGAHVVSWLIHVGPVPEGEVVAHACDTPGCVRPDHLFTGTQAENLMDCRVKGRRAPCEGQGHWTRRKPEAVPSGASSFSAQHPERLLRGVALPQSKLTPDKVRRIRRLLKRGSTQDKVATLFGIHRTAVSAIAVGRNWRHVQ